MERSWQLKPVVPNEVLQRFPELPGVVVQLLWNRGLTDPRGVDIFLSPDWSRDIHDPFLFRDMEKAVERIIRANEGNEKITIHGDYDADGVCASAILETTIRALGGTTSVFLPHRDLDGYGLNERTVGMLALDGTRVIITCDCGIANVAEIKAAQEHGIDVIITDHHTIGPELPPAYAILHPLVAGETYPDRTLSGGGVAFKLAQALLQKARDLNYQLRVTSYELPDPGFEKWLLDLAAISTVADMVPLRGESRTLTHYGLIVLNKTRRMGLQKLIEVAGIAGKRQDTHTIGFQIAPRINAAGRMDHASAAYRLLVSEDEAEATALAAELQKNNQERQRVTDRALIEAKFQVVAQGQDQDSLIVVGDRSWPLGIVGLIAGKLADEFARPALVMTEREGTWTGSGRSVPGFNLYDALGKVRDHFAKFGGHSQACGFTLQTFDNLPGLARDLRAIASAAFGFQGPVRELTIEAAVSLRELDWELWEHLSKFAPFGQENPVPRFGSQDLIVRGIDPVGNEGKHLRLHLASDDGAAHKFIGFSFGHLREHLGLGDRVDVVYEIGVNEWNGNRDLQFKMVDLRPSGNRGILS